MPTTGASVLALFLALGPIAGTSAIVSATLRGSVAGAEHAWRAAFLLGLAAGPLLATAPSIPMTLTKISAGPAHTAVSHR
jgi:hypothetical protein